MIRFRIAYQKDGTDFLTPFIFDNIEEARQARKHFKDLGRYGVHILCSREEDNIHTK
jgi:hypothetical protein